MPNDKNPRPVPLALSSDDPAFEAMGISSSYVRKRMESVTFLDLFDLSEIQRIQDEFSRRIGVATIITTPLGEPITGPSNFCRLCRDVIRKTDLGLSNCMKSDALIGAGSKDGPVVSPCLSGGLWDAGASIYVGEKHLANWLIGQVRNEAVDSDKLLQYAAVIGADQDQFRAAMAEVPSMSLENFTRVSEMLFMYANQLSRLAHKNFEMSLQMELQQRLEVKLRHLALHDTLTTLPNRALCLDRIRQAQQRLQRDKDAHFSVIFLDMDRFKVINDSLGHATGDFVLREIAERLQHAVRGVDTVSRMGGDEFVIVLESISHPREVVRAAMRIRAAVQAPMRVGSKQLHCNASIGIDLTPERSALPEDIIRNADMAMHFAKKVRPGYIKVFTQNFRQAELERMDIETDLDRGLEAGEFFMVYQPLYEVVGIEQQLCGFEALIRWDSARKGLIRPDQFIPMAEQNGRIIPLGALALEQSCAFLARFIKRHPKLAGTVISVNASPSQFYVGDIAAVILATLKRHGLRGSNLKLEITETTIMKASSAVFEKVGRLTAQGVKLSVDDFGVGYSNLSMLTQLPLDNLKIDISLVRLLGVSTETTSVVRAIIMMARSLGLDVIAEGVETREQLTQLLQLGCKTFQGYLFSRPLSEADALERGGKLVGKEG